MNWFRFQIEMLKNEEQQQQQQQQKANTSQSNKINLDQIASVLLKQNLILTALELHTELAENGRELPRLRDYFSNPANFEQANIQSIASSSSGAGMSSAGYPLHKASSIQTFDSLDLTRYSDDVDANKAQDDKIAVLEFELRKAKETINQLRNTLTLATDTNKRKHKHKSIKKFLSDIDSNEPSQHGGDTAEPNEHDQDDEEEGDNNTEEDYDLVETNEATQKTMLSAQQNVNNASKKNHANDVDMSAELMMPHDKHTLNFLINEYLLEQNYKMTSITFAEENEAQDLEDWDLVGLNRAKPPNLFHLYKFYSNRNMLKNAEVVQQVSTVKSKNVVEVECQTENVAISDASSNTPRVEQRNAETQVNFDRETFETQRLQISKLLEKQEILLKSIDKLETDINELNAEKENNLRRIDLMWVLIFVSLSLSL